MKKVRWGIISTANIAQSQLIPAIFRAENAEVSAIASRSNKVHAIASRLNIPKAYESYEEIVADPAIDAVYIPLPNHLHKEWVLKAAAAGKHILCEKPAALTAADAEGMIATCQSAGVKFMEGFMYQLHPQHARVKEIMASGEIGDVKLIRSSHSFYLENRVKDIRMDKSMGGGALYDLGCYCIQAVRHLSEAEPVEVHAVSEIDAAAGVDMSASVNLKLDNGIAAIFDCSFDMASRNEYEVIGTKGTIKVPYAFRPDINAGVGVIVVETAGSSRKEEIHGDLYRLEVEHFSSAVLSGSPLAITADSTIRNMRVLDACFEASKTTKAISMDFKGKG
ncbi:Gfo/Idh/MocA family oxidoreductase [Planococcus sp. APC 3906]|uniref:Gfo/Idh/MocA family protein n=1 Tax=Planococcus sp. APC 3906 TaxID=3035194 RepID=UPI0025B5577A|nr:Gfo/Idh/MocA family oxidoreductase [Planococcus sp. APC 3906]MDN3449536.1 Gfo/Idh/MocA family oxidoreductase [Planococcus sp. APC 3906]